MFEHGVEDDEQFAHTRDQGRIQSCAVGGHRIAVSSHVSCGLASRADRLPLLLHVEHPGVYQWTGQSAGLTEGSTVEVSLTLAE